MGRFYLRVLLATLPSAEVYLRKFAKLMQKLDGLTDRLERYLTEQAVALANDARARREALEAVERVYAARDAKTLATINDTRTKLEKAASARDAVSDFLDRL